MSLRLTWPSSTRGLATVSRRSCGWRRHIRNTPCGFRNYRSRSSTAYAPIRGSGISCGVSVFRNSAEAQGAVPAAGGGSAKELHIQAVRNQDAQFDPADGIVYYLNTYSRKEPSYAQTGG